jgi:hypothetical protein
MASVDVVAVEDHTHTHRNKQHSYIATTYYDNPSEEKGEQ